MEPDGAYLPHLLMGECSVGPGTDWTPKSCAWTLIQVVAGGGYWIGSPTSQELDAGAVLLLSAGARGSIRASLLGELVLRFFAIEPRRLAGVLTLHELRLLETAANKEEFCARLFAPDSPVAVELKRLCAGQSRNGCLVRLQLLQIFIGAFGHDIHEEPAERTSPRKAKERIETFLRQTPASELLNFSLADLAQMTRCTPRHLNRIFKEVAGISFRAKHTELRLARACELLATTEAKVVDVALESGYQSLSLFNLMFTRRFGMSPGRWRQNQRQGKAAPSRRINQKGSAWLPDKLTGRLGNRANITQSVI